MSPWFGAFRAGLARRVAIVLAVVPLGLGAAPPVAAAGCQPGPTALCLNGGRFRVEIAWKDFAGRTGAGQGSALTDDSGTFWFFNPANLEVVVKVLDGRIINGKWWFFYGALSNVEYTITVTDTATGARRTYHNPSGRFASEGDTAAFPAAAQDFRVLVFTKATGFRHDSIPDGIALVQALGAAHGFGVDVSENAALFTPQGLGAYRAVIFLNTTGEVLNGSQQAAFEAYVRGGGGWVGVHSAADTEYAWPFYGELLGNGAWFLSHPPIQAATLRVEDGTHPSTRHYPASFSFTDEWYNFRANPRGAVDVLLAIDEGSYSPGSDAMGGDHPIAWCHSLGSLGLGRAWYTTLGHRSETYGEATYAQHLLGGILWAAGRASDSP
ncbi:MAG: cytochrome c [Acidobacteriota bacterium]|jgi:type 1 glutamine amidotransferase|nr:cytochrome c [Acidobacteriota bacterium]